MTGDIRTDIPAADIPRFPVLRLIWRSDGTITLDDTPLDIEAGEDSRVAALKACAQHARQRGGDQPTIRVIATDEASSSTWPMGVTADGDIVELEEVHNSAPSETKQPRFSRRALITGGALAGAAVLGGGGVATALFVHGRQETTPTAPPPPPGHGDLVPVAVPDGYEPTAQWTTAVARNTQAQGLSDERILTVANDSNNLRIHNATTGAVEWTGTGNTNSLQVHEVTIDGRPFLLALDSSAGLKLWPLDQETTIAATALKLPARDGLLYTSGAGPAVSLPTQTAYIFNGPEGVELDVPVGYQAISGTADGQAVILGARDWAILAPGQKSVKNPTELLLPSKKHKIEGGFMLGEDRLLVRIAGPDKTTWGLYATDGSNALVTVDDATSGSMPEPDTLQSTPDRTTWALDGLVAQHDSLHAVDNAKITAVTSLGVYADGPDGPVLIHASTGESTPLPDGTVPPSIAEDEHAVIITEKLETTTAYVMRSTAS